jgi:anti-sigma28 factor (negative regulator of flagellin synthesis)
MKDFNDVTAAVLKELSKNKEDKIKKIRQRVNTGSYKIQSLQIAKAIVGTPENSGKK